ncbi:SDR family NAD(P)-dependent oxidoreductase [Nocardia sp. NPDC055321]
MTTTSRTALITGASAGIGAAFAHHLAAQGHHLLLVARRVDRLRTLAAQLTDQHGVRCEVFAADLTDAAAPTAILNYAEQQGLDVDILINNAGLSGKTAFADTPWDALAGEIQLMVTAPTQLVHLVVPGMKERRWGRIINLSSAAAFAPPAASLLYTGIKSYVLNTSQSLDMELKPHGIHVTALCPGFTRTEFHDVMGTRDRADNLPRILWQRPEAVVTEGWDAVMKGKPVCVPGTFNKIGAAAMKPLPVGLGYLAGKTLNPFKNTDSAHSR